MSNNAKLNKEEEKILADYEAGRLRRVKNEKREKIRYQQYVKQTFSKSRNINIRLPERDLQRIKTLAAEKGLPYQTFISSLLHQYSSKKVKESVS